jgi:hypothetical protein
MSLSLRDPLLIDIPRLAEYFEWSVWGADLDESPLNIVTSDEMFWFYKY